MQWNFSIDRELGFNTGLRVSYIGQGTRDLVYAPDLNQSVLFHHVLCGAAFEQPSLSELGRGERSRRGRHHELQFGASGSHSPLPAKD